MLHQHTAAAVHPCEAPDGLWFIFHRLCKAWEQGGPSDHCGGAVKIDEGYVGGNERNKHGSNKLKAGRGPVGTASVAGIKDPGSNTIAASLMTSVMKDSVGKMYGEWAESTLGAAGPSTISWP